MLVFRALFRPRVGSCPNQASALAAAAVAVFVAFTPGLILPICAQQAAANTGATPSPALPANVQAKLDKLQADLQAAQANGDAGTEATQLIAIGDLYNAASAYSNALDAYNQALVRARAAKDAKEEAAALNGIAGCYRNQGRNGSAQETYLQALDLATSSGDRKGQATALHGLGWVFTNTSQYQKGLDAFNRALPIYRQLGNRAGEARTLLSIGVLYVDTGKLQEALDFYNQALAIYRQARDRTGEAITLYTIGTVYDGRGDTQKALEFYNDALPILHEVANDDIEAATLNNIARICDGQGEKQKAAEFYIQALPIYRRMADHNMEATTLANIARAFSDAGEKQKALDFSTQALQLYRQMGDRVDEAGTLNNIGLAYSSLQQKQKALDTWNQALTIERALPDRALQARTLNNIGVVYNDLGERQKALDSYNQALPIDRAGTDRIEEAKVLNNIGVVYNDIGDTPKALEYLNQALPLCGQANDRVGEAMTLNNFGTVYSGLGQKQKALDFFNRALPIYRQTGDRANEAETLSNLGAVYDDLGLKQKALDDDNQALTIQRNLGDLEAEARTLNNMGNVYDELGQKQKALDYYNQALPMKRQAGDRNGEANTLNNIANAWGELNQKQKALDYFNEALAIQRQVADRAGEATTLNNIGVVYDGFGEKKKELDYYNQALPLRRQAGDRAGEAITLSNIGAVYQDLGEQQKALDYYNQALPIATSAGDPLLEAIVLHHLMMNRRGQFPALAIFYGKQAINLVQQVRGNIQTLDKSLQQSFLSSKENYYHDLADLLIAQGRLPEAQQVLDLLKQQEYKDYVRGETADTISPVSLTPAEKQAQEDYEKSTEQIVALAEQWSLLKKNRSRTPEQEQQFQQLSAQVNAASRGLSDYYKRLYTLFSNSSEANNRLHDMEDRISPLQRVIAKMPHTVALYTLVGSQRYSVIVVTGSTAVVREYPIAEKDLNQKVAAFQQALRDPNSDPRPLAQELYKILIGPVRTFLDQAHAQTLVWSLDGALRYVPMAALYDGRQYVVENYNTVTFTPEGLDSLTATPDVSTLSVVAMGISRQYETDLPALPAVVGELDDIVQDSHVQGANGVLPGTILLNSAFTQKAMENQLGGPHTVVHIASHFVFQPGDDSQSYLLLAGKDQGGNGFRLTVADFHDDQNLSLEDTDLLTLSACETGMSGTASNGREVDGLGITAQLKGAKAVISSLWEVNDASTGKLMADFYRRWAAGGGKVAKVEALRQAQLDLLHGKVAPQSGSSGRGLVAVQNGAGAQSIPTGYAHPYFWAPFVLMGNWR